MRLCKEKIRRPKAQLDLYLDTAVKDNEKIFINTQANIGGLRKIFIFHWMCRDHPSKGWGTLVPGLVVDWAELGSPVYDPKAIFQMKKVYDSKYSCRY